MNIPKNLMYTKSHEWVEIIDDTTIKTGLTEYAVNELGELVFINVPEIDDEVTVEGQFSDVESVKAVSDFLSPATGKITAINEQVIDEPGSVNGAPYEVWFAEISNVTEKRELLTAEEYEQLLAEEA